MSGGVMHRCRPRSRSIDGLQVVVVILIVAVGVNEVIVVVAAHLAVLTEVGLMPSGGKMHCKQSFVFYSHSIKFLVFIGKYTIYFPKLYARPPIYFRYFIGIFIGLFQFFINE